jgi:parallel beta-helix repeat protein
MALETIYIRANGSVEPYYAPIQRTGDVYTLTTDINSDVDGIVIEKNDTILNGAGHRLQGMNVQFSRGVYLSGNSNVTIKNITVASFENGILLDAYSIYNTIIDSKFEGNDYGVSCWAFSDNNTIAGDNMTANSLAGLWIVGSSNVTVTNNYIMNNNQYGIILESSYNDTICHNNFIGNTNQVNIYDSSSTWDNGYPSGGNYWNDYADTDIYSGPDQNQPGSDGIGDIPYDCGEDNQDRYPLMQVFTNVAVQGAKPVKTIVGQGYNATIAIQVENQGWETRTTNVQVTLDSTTILTLNDLVMAGKNRTILTYTWQTSGYSRGNYTVSATVTTVPSETDITDNYCTWMIHVGVPGDVSSSTAGVYEGIVNMRDISYIILLFNTRPGSFKWNPNADVNNDGIVNMRDISIAILNFNQHE